MFKKDADILSPLRVFGFIWSILFALANLKLSKLQYEWTFGQWSNALMGPVSFLLGVFIVYCLNIGTRVRSIKEMHLIFSTSKVNEVKLFYIIIITFILYLIGYLIIYLVKGYIPIFALNAAAARIDYFIFGIGLFILHMPIIVFFVFVYHLFVEGKKARKLILKVIAFITSITYLFLLQRYTLIMASVMVFTLLYYASRYIRFRTILLFAILGIFVFYSVATLRSGKIIQLVLYKTSLMKFSPEYAIFTEPYMYMVMNIENFVQAVSKLNYYTYGAYTFDWIFALIQLKYPMKEYFGLVDNPFTIGSYNTHTFFWTFYRDFGLFGITIIPLIGGLLVGSIHYAMRRKPSIELISFYSVMVFVMALSFFINPLGFLWFVYIIAWIVIILKLTRIKNQVSE